MEKIPSATKIFREALSIYAGHFRVLFSLAVIPLAVWAIFGATTNSSIGTGSTSSALSVASTLLFCLVYAAAVIVSLWAQAAIIFVVKDAGSKVGFTEAIARGSHKVWSIFGAMVLTTVAVVGTFALAYAVGGLLFFGLIPRLVTAPLPTAVSPYVFAAILAILSIPGLVIAVCYSLSMYVVVGDDVQSVLAVERSGDYVKGLWWPVFWRMAFILVAAMGLVLCGMLASSLLTAVGRFLAANVGGNTVAAVMGVVVPALLTPLYAAYGYRLYANVKEVKGESKIRTRKSVTVIVTGALVALATLAAATWFGLSILSAAKIKAKDTQRAQDIQTIGSALDQYAGDHGTYPQQLSGLVPVYIEAVPVSPEPADGSCTEQQNSYTYRPVDSQSSYTLNFCTGGSISGVSAGAHTMSGGKNAAQNSQH